MRNTKTAATLPRRVATQQPVLVGTVPDGPGWVHEIKHDGWRILAFRDGERTRLVSRQGRDWTAAFAPVAAALGPLACRDAILDGEVAAPDEAGITRLAQLRGCPPGRLVYYVFDLLWLDGEDLRPRPLLERKARLERLLRPAGGRVLYSDHVEAADGPALYERAVQLGCEGIVSKRADAPYGGRRTWRKIKPAAVRARQAEAVRRGRRG